MILQFPPAKECVEARSGGQFCAQAPLQEDWPLLSLSYVYRVMPFILTNIGPLSVVTTWAGNVLRPLMLFVLFGFGVAPLMLPPVLWAKALADRQVPNRTAIMVAFFNI